MPPKPKRSITLFRVSILNRLTHINTDSKLPALRPQGKASNFVTKTEQDQTTKVELKEENIDEEIIEDLEKVLEDGDDDEQMQEDAI